VEVLFDQLVYGKNDMFWLQKGTVKPVTLHLNESVPEMLMIIGDDMEETSFDLRHCNIIGQSYQHEI
jgi:hypothetical protein